MHGVVTEICVAPDARIAAEDLMFDIAPEG